jgi:hypothetical protein
MWKPGFRRATSRMKTHVALVGAIKARVMVPYHWARSGHVTSTAHDAIRRRANGVGVAPLIGAVRIVEPVESLDLGSIETVNAAS